MTTTGAYALRPAERSDASKVSALVDAAYGHYVERLGMLPGPMTEDYARVIRDARVTVAERDGTMVGVIVLDVTDEGFVIENVAVAPTERGRGLGRILLELAEDRGPARRVHVRLSLHAREDDREPSAVLKDRIRRVRPARAG